MGKANKIQELRIAMINSEYPPVGGGAGNATYHLAKEFLKAGHQVSVITSRLPDNHSTEHLDGCQVNRVPSYRKSAQKSNPFEQLSFLLGSCTKGLKILYNWKPDIVIAFFGVPSGPAAYLNKLITKVPYVISLRGGDVPGFRTQDFSFYHRISAPLIRLVWKKADSIVANSSGLRELALNFDNNRQIDIITNGVDPSRYSLNKNSWEEQILLFTGRLVYQKGVDILLNALAEVKNNDYKFIIVGDGPEKNNLEKQAMHLGIDKKIVFTGWLDRNQIITMYNKANIFVFPSRQEGMPNSILEAMSSGLPVIATNISGNEELIIDGKGGYLIPPENQMRLTNALDILLENKRTREEMGRYNRERIMEKFCWIDIANMYIDLFKSLDYRDISNNG